jgi:hypothetical protein
MSPAHGAREKRGIGANAAKSPSAVEQLFQNGATPLLQVKKKEKRLD